MAMTTGGAGEALHASPGRAIPPLRNGDRLTRPEFERRFDAAPGLKVAELIDGRVYVPVIGSAREHAFPCFDMIGWLGQFPAAVPGVRDGAHSSVRLDWDNMPQPDAILMISPGCGGQARVDTDEAGLYKSEVFPGLWLDPTALIRGDLATAVQALQEGLASLEHAAFVARLKQAKE